MDNNSTQQLLDRFGRRVIKEARTSLTKQKKNASKELYDSLRYDSNVSKNSFQLSIYMEDYGKFVDQGVTGKNDPNFKGNKKEVHKSLSGFRYGSNNFEGKGDEWKKKIDKWMYSRGIQPRDRGNPEKGIKGTGRFIKRDTVNFLIRRSIYQHGAKPTRFLQKPFESAFKIFPDEFVKSYGLDVEKFFKSTQK